MSSNSTDRIAKAQHTFATIQERQLNTRSALQLRLQGLSEDQISTNLDLPADTVRSLIIEALALAPSPDLTEVRSIELIRLDAYLRYLQPAIQKGDARAVQTALQISKERRTLLGIDAPVQHTIATPLDNSITALLNEMAQQQPSTEAGHSTRQGEAV